jgi:hypothetical protein
LGSLQQISSCDVCENPVGHGTRCLPFYLDPTKPLKGLTLHHNFWKKVLTYSVGVAYTKQLAPWDGPLREKENFDVDDEQI